MLDLIDECGEDLSSCGFETRQLGMFGMTASKLVVDSVGKAKKLGFERGHYFILNAPKLSYLMQEHRDVLMAEVAIRLEFLFKENKVKKSDKVLLVGIGNPKIMADSFGVQAVEKVPFEPFRKNNRIYKIMPNVFVSTGLKSSDIIRLLVEAYDIRAVVLFDSLATSNISRLGCSIQFNDAGLTPGSALNNFGVAINKNTLNVSCFAIGVPMMFSSTELKQCKDLILTEKDVEEKVNFLSDVVGEVVGNLLN